MAMGMRPSIFGCLAGGSLGGSRSRRFFVLGIGFLMVGKLREGKADRHCAHNSSRLILVFRLPKNSDLTTPDSGVITPLP